MQAKINLLEAKQGVVSSFSHSQDNKAKLSINLDELKGEPSNRTSTIYDYDTRLTQLELLMANWSCNDTLLQDFETRILRLEADMDETDDDIQAKIDTYSLAFWNSISELENETAIHNLAIEDHDKILTLLESDMADCSCNKTNMHDYDTRILQLEEDIVDTDGAIQTLELQFYSWDLTRQKTEKTSTYLT